MASAKRYSTMAHHEKPNKVPWNPKPVRVLQLAWAASAMAQSRLHSEPNLRFVLTSDFAAWLGSNRTLLLPSRHLMAEAIPNALLRVVRL